MTTIPPLPHGCGSWIVTAPNGRVYELFDAANVRKAAAADWRIETAADYLARINRTIRDNGGIMPA